MKLNQNFFRLEDDYLFSKITEKTEDFSKKNPGVDFISLGIGDTTLPLCETVIRAMQKAVDEMSRKKTYRGYGPEHGYFFLREAIANYYKKRQVSLSPFEIFVSDGAGRDIADITELFDRKSKVLTIDPAYPAYKDACIIDNNEIIFLKTSEKNNFIPVPDYDIDCDIIYLCSPNNPTGAVYDKKTLEKWVDYALKKNAVIIFDSAYEAFISDEDLPRSIFEIENAKKCAIEIASLSKTAGFTGIRCGYTVISDELVFQDHKINELWRKRQSIKSNGLNYITQRGAEAVFSREGQKQIKSAICYYKKNIKVISSSLYSLGIWVFASSNSPYVWAKCPHNMNSWEFFDIILQKAHVIVTPGEGFGKSGKSFVRLSGFTGKKETLEAVNKIKNLKLTKDFSRFA
ncbi:MAG: LL-diaminopimelate aminotransferase [Oscillospiraceae bacterium]|nr:LL-diaminopimelate aminotransferase [Oscillospiraceae bacterium]